MVCAGPVNPTDGGEQAIETEADSHPCFRPSKPQIKNLYSSFNNLMPIPTTKWRLPTLLNSNARSIVNKIDEMTEIIENNKADIACVTETWLSDGIPPCKLL